MVRSDGSNPWLLTSAHRITASPFFVGLHWFHQGCSFKQWTGDNSKALMKVLVPISCISNWHKYWYFIQVYLPALKGYVPNDMICVLCTFLDFCYLACCDILDTQSLTAMQEALDHFHQYWEIFHTCGICSSFNLPQQHSLIHFIQMIWAFDTPNRLCSSITESKHIKAIKTPYWWSNHYQALGQMLLTNQCLDKLAAAWVDFKKDGMLKGTCLSHTLWLIRRLGKFWIKLYHSNYLLHSSSCS